MTCKSDTIKIIYELENCKIKICFEESLVRLYSDTELWRYLDVDIKCRSSKLVNAILTDYRKQFGKPLDISNDSLAVEIWAHVYSDYFGLIINRSIKIKWIQKLILAGIKRAEIIDCGESIKDGNRWVWDLLAHFKSFIVLFLPKNISFKMLK